jgi:hypothetical protein
VSDTVLFFAHIPKTGGSSVERYLAAKGPVALLHNRTAEWSRTTPQHMPAAVFRHFVPETFYDHGFAVLRDPKAKMISTFRMRAGRRHAWHNPLNWILYPLCRLRGPEVYAIRVWRMVLSLDFDTWFRIVALWRRRNPYIYDGHCLPQSAYVHPGHRLFLLEDGLEPVFRWIDAVTGTPPVTGTFHDRKGQPLPVRCAPATEARLRAVYAEDYALIAACRRARDAQEPAAQPPAAAAAQT